MEEQFPPLQEFIEKQWKTFTDFADHINQEKDLYLDGEGVIHLQTFVNKFMCRDVFYLFSINEQLYCSVVKEDREKHHKYFDGLYQLHNSLLTSKTFKLAQSQNYATKFNDFGTKIHIECKAYDYFEEHKLLFSKYGKVDLLYSHQLVINKNETISLKANVHPSLKEMIKWQKMVDKVNAKTEAYLERKRKERQHKKEED